MVDIIDGQDGQVAVITEVAESDARASLQLELVDDLLGGIKGNGHGEKVAIGKTAVLTDTNQAQYVSGLFWQRVASIVIIISKTSAKTHC